MHSKDVLLAMEEGGLHIVHAEEQERAVLVFNVQMVLSQLMHVMVVVELVRYLVRPVVEEE